MRTLIVTLAIVCGALTLPATHQSGTASAAPVISAVAVLDGYAAPRQTAQFQEPQSAPQPPQVNVEIKKSGGGRGWWANPVWMAIGGIALLLVIVLIVMAARGGGGGTTVVRG
jgi:hypothetical protein